MKVLTITLLAVFWGQVAGNAMAIEEAEYTVSEKQEAFEIRWYAPSIVAEVLVTGEFKDASNTAFRQLFKYISGNNSSRTKIAMTAPVSQEPQSEKIAMTAPVGQRPAGQGWAVSFMMPASYTMETIPTPLDSSVIIREMPAYHAAAIRYSGTWSEKRYNAHLEELQGWIEASGLKITGEPVWARYNMPLTPWFMRRNEILIPVLLQSEV